MALTVVEAQGVCLERILGATYPIWHEGLTREAYGRFDTAQAKTAWGREHRRRVALVEGADVLASATLLNLAGVCDERPVRVCGIGAVFADPLHRGRGHARALVERVLDDAARDGAGLALLFSDVHSTWCQRNGFERIPTTQVELSVAESPRHGAPMTLVRSGEKRDFAAIVAMGQVRAAPDRFHLDRDVDLVQYAITKKRLLAGLGPAGVHQLQFFIAEEGHTAAAYVVVSVAGSTWTIEVGEAFERGRDGAVAWIDGVGATTLRG